MSRLLVTALCAIASVPFLGCGSPPPAPSRVEVAAELISATISENQTLNSLADGTSWVRPNDQFRLLYDMPGSRTLFVAGNDQQGTFVALVGSQDGLPVSCPFAVRYGGREWGDAIESQGVMWLKAAGLESEVTTPATGSAYPDGTVLCLDEGARVKSLLLVSPQSSDQEPAGSGAAS